MRRTDQPKIETRIATIGFEIYAIIGMQVWSLLDKLDKVESLFSVIHIFSQIQNGV